MRNPFELRGKRVLVVGLAKTGVATSLFCAARGAEVTATDARGENEVGDAIVQLRAAGVNLELGGHHEDTFLRQDLIVPSPGVPADAPLLRAARAKGVTIWSEIELAGRFMNGRLIGITGSNGKTTTTSLIEHILKNAGFATILAGNIGTPLISRIEQFSTGADRNLPPQHQRVFEPDARPSGPASHLRRVWRCQSSNLRQSEGNG